MSANRSHHILPMFFVKVLWFCGSCGFLALRILTSSDPMLFLFKTSQNGGKLISWWWSNILSVLNAWRFCGFVVSACGFLALQILTPSSPIFFLFKISQNAAPWFHNVLIFVVRFHGVECFEILWCLPLWTLSSSGIISFLLKTSMNIGTSWNQSQILCGQTSRGVECCQHSI